MSPRPPPAPMAGFTLFELVLVLLVLGVLAVVAIPRIPAGLLGPAPDLQAAEDQLVGDLRQARAGAMVCGRNGAVEVVTGNGWVVDDNRSCLTSTLRGPRNLTGVSVSGDAFEFRYPFGALDPDSGDHVELTLSGGGESRTVCVRALTGALERGGC
ncbi:GspH/FimT family pseudopilin [Thioalkalivibrio sp. ALE19]|uniref:GspH/FimT family pseudopilin n=1 Tax=Thioalkalivibrio sp. ALE19 TaxID=1266909 RepID=UPI00040FBCF4|nr:GspH/FimT family pseudopilin [Thioalkalivibrio sp. ALE19]